MSRLKDLFKKDKAEDKQVVQTQEPVPATASGSDANAGEAASAEAEQKAKHGEPGVCCGSCH
ncbi:CCGSCS motif protein [Halomonas campisalis]|uniref:CCGSCS motif protein n=1 Tax=Billgrantia campisalis TaxID=74661 RepID=A0ABS9PBT5_9GAMM|nr:CCGSCS motif protein [Halomonas campisalis]MCG6659206.1 CCGSCS motif protein [Halomonas campisalis]MDR5864958.1 CCGSCS motif protein [Halomonas campisalis]